MKTLSHCIASGSLPHLLFHGPPGTGKTSAILAIARELFGPEFRNRVLEMNASQERGLAVVRSRIKQFAQVCVCSYSSWLRKVSLTYLVFFSFSQSSQSLQNLRGVNTPVPPSN